MKINLNDNSIYGIVLNDGTIYKKQGTKNGYAYKLMMIDGKMFHVCHHGKTHIPFRQFQWIFNDDIVDGQFKDMTKNDIIIREFMKNKNKNKFNNINYIGKS